jgi:uncharacterized SAM-binding protein YcdF (DUF218 family)
MTASSEQSGIALAARRRPRRALRFWAGLFAALVLLVAATFVARHALLREAAAVWIVSDVAAPADAAAVLGGGLEYRPFAVADYYRRGLVSKILVSNIGASPAERLGVLRSHVRANMEVLEKLGVPGAAIQPFGSNLHNTYEEVLALHDWAKHTGAHTILVPTDIFAARRLRWIMHRVFGNDAVVLVSAIDPPDYTRNDWWKTEGGVITFQNEVIKYVYYRVKY